MVLVPRFLSLSLKSLLEPHANVVQQLRVRAPGLQEVGFITALFQVHHRRGLEVFAELLLALDTAVHKLTDLLRVESRPHMIVELLMEFQDERRIDEVNERVTHTAPVLKIHRQVQKIVPTSVVLVNLLRQHLVIVLVRDVLDHDRGPIVSAR